MYGQQNYNVLMAYDNTIFDYYFRSKSITQAEVKQMKENRIWYKNDSPRKNRISAKQHYLNVARYVAGRSTNLHKYEHFKNYNTIVKSI